MSASSKDFFDLVKAIGESKSKQEEDRIVAEEVTFLKKSFSQSVVQKKKLKELVIRALYVEMLGQDASFAYIKAVELCASTSILQKRVGYLAAALCFSPGHEFRFMLVNQIQRDMNSMNQLDVMTALSAVCKIVTEDMIPAVIGDVVKLLTHDMESIRKKAICALHRLYQMDKSCVSEYVDKIRRVLCDKDPSVMGAVLPFIYDLSRDNVSDYKDLVPSLISILKQITEHRLPKEFDYHRIPAPWIQMALLKILAVLGRGDQASSEGMYEVLVDVMRRADTGINVGYAIVYEVVITVTSIYPNPLLLDAAATSISRFIRSDSNNLKYIGIKGLASIVKDHPKYAADHQMAVIDCLEDPDETLKRKTLDLLFRMTNAVNVEFIVEKLLSSLASATDDHFRTDLVGQVTQCAERFAPSNAWYVRTMVRVFELAGEKVKLSVAQTLMQLIAEGSDDDDEGTENDDLRTEAVEDFLELIAKPKLPSILAQSMVWVIGEYGYLSTTHSKEKVMEKLCDLCAETNDDCTRGYVITALMKLVAQNGACPLKVSQLISLYKASRSVDVQQRCHEFEALLANSSIMADVLPIDASCEDIEVDEELSFLSDYVNRALAAGAGPYSPPADLDAFEGTKGKYPVLKVAAYEKPHIPTAIPTFNILAGLSNNQPGVSGVGGQLGSNPPVNPIQATSSSGANSQGNQLLNYRSGNQVWGKKMEPVSPSLSTASNASIQAVSGPNVNLSSNGSGITTLASYNSSSQVNEQVAKEKSEKEKMAAALFGGLSSTSKPASGLSSRKIKSTSSTAVTTIDSSPPKTTATLISTSSPQSALQQSGASNLFNNLDLTSPGTNLSSPPPIPPAQSVNSLFDDMVTTAPQPYVTTMNNGSNALFDLNSMAANQIQPTKPSYKVPVVSSNQNSAITDVFASLDNLTLLPSKETAISAPPIVSTGPLNAINSASQAVIIIHPLQLTTAQFGQKWGQTSHELTGSVPSAIIKLDILVSKIPQNYHHVESIPATLEAIFSASTGVGGYILVHAKLQPGRRAIDLLIKATTKQLCSEQLSALTALLES